MGGGLKKKKKKIKRKKILKRTSRAGSLAVYAVKPLLVSRYASARSVEVFEGLSPHLTRGRTSAGLQASPPARAPLPGANLHLILFTKCPTLSASTSSRGSTSRSQPPPHFIHQVKCPTLSASTSAWFSTMHLQPLTSTSPCPARAPSAWAPPPPPGSPPPPPAGSPTTPHAPAGPEHPQLSTPPRTKPRSPRRQDRRAPGTPPRPSRPWYPTNPVAPLVLCQARRAPGTLPLQHPRELRDPRPWYPARTLTKFSMHSRAPLSTCRETPLPGQSRLSARLCV